MAKEIIIKIYNDRILLNPNLSIPIQFTNIPKEYLTFRSNKDIFWKVEMLEYTPFDQGLRINVTDYSITDTRDFDSQKPKKPIKKLIFEKFDWKKLEMHLIQYQKIYLDDFLFNHDSQISLENEKSYYSKIKERNKEREADEKNSINQNSSKTEKITESFWVNFTESQFKLGYVSFKKFLYKLETELDFKISNDHILAEFDNIKFWFARKLKSNKFKVDATIIINNDVVTETIAYSKHIDKITPELIDGIKYQRNMAFSKVPFNSLIDKSIFSSEDIFNQIDDDDLEGNVFNQTEEDILNFFLNQENIRNKKQLAYLAGKKQSENNKLRFTLYPDFGFLFFIEGKEYNHFVWELLKSHATYIWSIEKGKQNLDLQFKRIEDSLNKIRTLGRENYKRDFRYNNLDSDLVFRVINHEDIDSDFVDHFPKWKSRLNEQLI